MYRITVTVHFLPAYTHHVVNSLLFWLAADTSPDGHRLAVLVEASSAAVEVRVSRRCHGLLPRPDGFG